VLDGKAFRPDGLSAATLIPPAFGLRGVNLHTWTGWGSLTYWNAFVANIEMHGKGTFHDSRLENAAQFPIAAQAGFAHITPDRSGTGSVDRITPKLAALHYFQLSLPAPTPPAGSFDEVAAAHGEEVFDEAGCARCHVEPLFTEPGWNMHVGADIGIDEFQAQRSPDHAYRTTPLRGLWTHTKGGFFHDGRFATLEDVVHHYDQFFGLNLSAADQSDLVQYLLSL
jgi:cytochrome c peroxidase